MRGFTLLIAGLLGLATLPAGAASLTVQLNQFFKARYGESGQNADTLVVVVKTPQSQWPACDTPRFSLPGNSRIWGNMSVAANCDQNRRYLQVEVQVTGSYIVATRVVPRGTAITAADIKTVRGRLDTLPARTVMSAPEITDAVALRDIIPGQPLTMMMVRQPWRVKAGQNVTVVASGDGFNVSSEGRAMNNATATQPVRVRMSSGQIVSGKVAADGNILITL
ncbi:flagellar basal body P-ring formation chaperone FlgA [Erwinia psidii]|uniref:Flagella basal body P-ring formation protein FlgA n=1 Tax=Erwinia psidii TaxID=69224 RepID=A0A3N6S6B0_9GAMM|nr:flagellar basal body P-ring formation chaperone FlgA [Erwinia psidii]MCX8956382.1 flagellar basal body P-ring formation protein FlgA [Erwinia psidii]MCX8959860.1 flagellar basal body P-ring formation protein FlgA [Erwinia psidii]MCX8966492.1 flagellar basal body P-ring formation protein FlgA [Erwinia psidii]RQM36560.1 flagellar basal body P-ring formation protein FlgA [Erwinia psidii]